jgi:hypothetical protein
MDKKNRKQKWQQNWKQMLYTKIDNEIYCRHRYGLGRQLRNRNKESTIDIKIRTQNTVCTLWAKPANTDNKRWQLTYRKTHATEITDTVQKIQRKKKRTKKCTHAWWNSKENRERILYWQNICAVESTDSREGEELQSTKYVI